MAAAGSFVDARILAFRAEETEGRKVYEANGEPMDPFSELADGLSRHSGKGLPAIPFPRSRRQ